MSSIKSVRHLLKISDVQKDEILLIMKYAGILKNNRNTFPNRYFFFVNDNFLVLRRKL
jgi:ornithine carbamoyltransferase